MTVQHPDAPRCRRPWRAASSPNGSRRRATPSRSGDVVAEIETDKATMEVEAVDQGVLGRAFSCPAGTENVAVNTPIAVIALGGRGRRTALRPAPTAANPGLLPSAPACGRPRPAAPIRPAPQIATAGTNNRDRRSRRFPKIRGTRMLQMTMREALRDAMAEEMRRDDTIFVLGEEVGEYQGAYKVTQGLLQEFGARRIVERRSRRWLRGPRRRCGLRRAAPSSSS